MASILVQAIPQITCCSCGSSGSSFSSIGPRQSNKLFTLSLRRGLQRQRKRFFNHPEAGNGNGNNFISPGAKFSFRLPWLLTRSNPGLAASLMATGGAETHCFAGR
ncbi:uncharacterized protein LOC131033890 isoform X2 [Cryptomeria japonica]|uniref:uncharacterized protein LOC131033890 isoform X2 n=1 Tax=Cryptomeria japonica TaxID=3369 RepID=UPI0025ABB8A8|nr:uncharacterized protein LOC131033890 isoform X2 [Cryptomeria japonica]